MKHLKLATLLGLKIIFVLVFSAIYWVALGNLIAENTILLLGIYCVSIIALYFFFIDFILRLLKLE